MAFSFLDWLIGQSLDLAVSKTNTLIQWKELKSKLDKEIDLWATQLPKHCELVSIAMYLDISSKDDTNKSLKILGRQIDSGLLPTENLILDALLEQWHICKSYTATQPFFLIDVDEAVIHLAQLSARLSGILLQEELLFKRFVQQHLAENKNDTEEIKGKLKIIEELIKKLNSQHPVSNSHKIFRPIPKCDILLHSDKEYQKYLTIAFLKIALYQSFKAVKYKKFTCLFNYSDDLFQSSDGTRNPGISLWSGEVIFLGNCQKLVELFCNSQDRFTEILEQYYGDPEFNEINLKIQFLSVQGLIPYEIEIDGQNGRYNISLLSFKGIDYQRLHSLNTVLPFIASMTEPRIQVIDYDRIAMNSAMLNLVYKALIDDEIDLSLLEVNVDNFDDWNYHYTIEKASD